MYALQRLVLLAATTCAMAAGGCSKLTDLGLKHHATMRIEKLDPATGKFTELAKPLYETEAGGVELGGKIYLMGGFYDALPSNAAEVFDPATGAWSPLKPWPKPRISPFVAVGTLLCAVGGRDGPLLSDVDCFDTATNTWSTRAPHSMKGSPTVVTVGDKLYAFARAGEGGITTAEVHIYDPAADKWTTGASLPNECVPLAVVPSGTSIYALGCRSGGSSPTEVIVYDTIKGEWLDDGATVGVDTTINPGFDSAIVVGTSIVVYVDDHFGFDRYDMTTKKWSQTPRPPIEPYQAATWSIGGKLIVVDLVDPNGDATSDNAAAPALTVTYDPATNAWKTLGRHLDEVDSTRNRTTVNAVTIGGSYYLVGFYF